MPHTSRIDRIQSEYWSRQTRRRHPSDPIIASFVRPKLELLLKHADLPPSVRILDVGCGNGYFTYYLQRLGSAVGLDYSKAMLDLNPCSNRVQASALNLPFADCTFDLVFCANLLHHLPDAMQAAAEMRRVSRRYVAFSEPNRSNPLMLTLGLLRREERQLLRFTAGFLIALASAVGLRVLICETAGFVTPNRMPRFIAGIAARCTAPSPFAAYSTLLAEVGAEVRAQRA